MTTLKNAGNWEFLGSMFRMKGPSFERTFTAVVDNLTDVLYEVVVER